MTVYAPASPGSPVDADQLMSTEPKALYDRWDAQLAASRSPTSRWTELESALYNACMDAAREDWDGYGANAVSGPSATHTRRLLALLPTTFPAPSIGVDADGEVSLEWHGEPGSLVSISVSPSAELTYAGVFGNAYVHGREPFSTRFPAPLLGYLQRLFDRGGDRRAP